MVESDTAAGPGIVERDALLATKLHAPLAQPGLVVRPRLAGRLDQQVLLVCAPAGYGKTTLLGEWARLGRRCAWLSLDPGDNDPVRFWRHVFAAVAVVQPGIDEPLTRLLGPPAPQSFTGVVTGLINGLVSPRAADQTTAECMAAEIGLVLDDYHMIDSPQVHASVAFLVEHLPARLHLALASRSDPPLALARLRARGHLAEVRAAELRFTAEEAAELLHHATGTTLAARVVDKLTDRTEGWAAGLKLAALSLRGRTDAEDFVATFSGSHRFVLDYLIEEVLKHQSDPIRTFMLETSVLQRLNADLCDAVTGRTGSQSMLEQVESAGLFLMPLDDVRGWWRYHHLFADLLRSRQAQQLPERTEQLHRAAAVWFDQHGLPDEAIHHALAAGDMAWAARLIEQHFDDVFNLRGEQGTIDRWLPALPAEVVRSRPRLLLAQSQMLGMRGDVPGMCRLIDAAEQVSITAEQEPSEDVFEASIGRSGSLLINVPAMIALQRSYIAQLRGDADETERYASEALAKLEDDETMLTSAVQGFLAVAQWMRGDLAAAEHQFAGSINMWRAAGQVTTTAWGDYCLARVQRAQGRLDAAARTCLRALEFAAGPNRQVVPAAAPAFTGLAQIAYQRNELDTALEHVGSAIVAGRQFVHTPPLAAALAALAWMRQARGDPDGAREAMVEAGRVALGPGGLFNSVPAQRARLLLAQGEVAAAARWTRERGLHPDDEVDYPRESGHLVLARVLLAQGEPELALRILDRLHAAALAQHRGEAVIEAGALRALALAAAGRHTESIEALAEALGLGCPQRYIRVFADEGAPMGDLLRGLLAARREGGLTASIPIGYLVEVRHAIDDGDPGVQPDVLTPMLDPLTSRELEVLGLLADGASNQAIAAGLFVSLDTVKKHVSHILRKLSARNRTEAVASARELHLVN